MPPPSSHLVPLLLRGKKFEKEGMDSQVLLFKEEQDISWNLITIFALSYQHVSAPGLLQGLIPWSCYFSMCNAACLRLGCAFWDHGLVRCLALPDLLLMGELHRVLPCLHRQRVLFSIVFPLPASACAVYVLESVSPLLHPRAPVSFSRFKVSQRSSCL